MSKKKYKAIVSDILTKKYSEKRYVVVDYLGNILDNNENYGYHSENQALTKYELKHFGKSSHQIEKSEAINKKRHKEKSEEKRSIQKY